MKDARQGPVILAALESGVLMALSASFSRRSPEIASSAGQRSPATGIITVSPVSKDSAPIERPLFKASHANVAVEAGSIAYLESTDMNVSDEPSGAAQGQLAACCNGSLDVALHCNARSQKRGRDRRPLGDLNVSSHVHFAVDAAFDPHMAFRS